MLFDLKIARKYGRCFLCLFKGHRASNCSNKFRFKNCSGSHHIALCEANLKDYKMHDEKTKETDNELLRKRLLLLIPRV